MRRRSYASASSAAPEHERGRAAAPEDASATRDDHRAGDVHDLHHQRCARRGGGIVPSPAGMSKEIGGRHGCCRLGDGAIVPRLAANPDDFY
jgi:hypothetical protein